MTTRADFPTEPKERPRWHAQVWFTIAVFAAVFCGMTVIGAFTWMDEVNWLTFAFAAVGTVAFTVNAWRLRLELVATEGEDTRFGLWLAASFWTVFGLGTAYSVFHQAIIAEDGAGWLLLTTLSAFVVLMLWTAADLARKALRMPGGRRHDVR